jgi:hypothetical protein
LATAQQDRVASGSMNSLIIERFPTGRGPPIL